MQIVKTPLIYIPLLSFYSTVKNNDQTGTIQKETVTVFVRTAQGNSYQSIWFNVQTNWLKIYD